MVHTGAFSTESEGDSPGDRTGRSPSSPHPIDPSQEQLLEKPTVAAATRSTQRTRTPTTRYNPNVPPTAALQPTTPSMPDAPQGAPLYASFRMAYGSTHHSNTPTRLAEHISKGWAKFTCGHAGKLADYLGRLRKPYAYLTLYHGELEIIHGLSYVNVPGGAQIVTAYFGDFCDGSPPDIMELPLTDLAQGRDANQPNWSATLPAEGEWMSEAAATLAQAQHDDLLLPYVCPLPTAWTLDLMTWPQPLSKQGLLAWITEETSNWMQAQQKAALYIRTWVFYSMVAELEEDGQEEFPVYRLNPGWENLPISIKRRCKLTIRNNLAKLLANHPQTPTVLPPTQPPTVHYDVNKPKSYTNNTESESDRLNPLSNSNNTESDRLNPLSHSKNTESDRLNPLSSSTNPESDRLNPLSNSNNTESDRLNPLSNSNNPQSDRLNPLSNTNNPQSDRLNPLSNTYQHQSPLSDTNNPQSITNNPQSKPNNPQPPAVQHVTTNPQPPLVRHAPTNPQPTTIHHGNTDTAPRDSHNLQPPPTIRPSDPVTTEHNVPPHQTLPVQQTADSMAAAMFAAMTAAMQNASATPLTSPTRETTQRQPKTLTDEQQAQLCGYMGLGWPYRAHIPTVWHKLAAAHDKAARLTVIKQLVQDIRHTDPRVDFRPTAEWVDDMYQFNFAPTLQPSKAHRGIGILSFAKLSVGEESIIQSREEHNSKASHTTATDIASSGRRSVTCPTTFLDFLDLLECTTTMLRALFTEYSACYQALHQMLRGLITIKRTKGHKFTKDHIAHITWEIVEDHHDYFNTLRTVTDMENHPPLYVTSNLPEILPHILRGNHTNLSTPPNWLTKPTPPTPYIPTKPMSGKYQQHQPTPNAAPSMPPAHYSNQYNMGETRNPSRKPPTTALAIHPNPNPILTEKFKGFFLNHFGGRINRICKEAGITRTQIAFGNDIGLQDCLPYHLTGQCLYPTCANQHNPGSRVSDHQARLIIQQLGPTIDKMLASPTTYDMRMKDQTPPQQRQRHNDT